MANRSLLFTCVLIFFSLQTSTSAQEYRDVSPGDTVSVPHGLYYLKDYRLQWWYVTGHLNDSAGREFGYELTFFVIGIQKKQFKSKFGTNNIYISHFAVSDIEKKMFYYTDDTDMGAFGFAGASEDRLKVWLGKNSLEAAQDGMHIHAVNGDTSIHLRLRPEKKAVLNGVDGYSRKSEESPLVSSLYFSYTNLETEGSLSLDGTVFRVKGKSWFDREISSRSLGRNYAGWDWFSIQLDDDREVMLYLIRKKNGTIDRFSSGTLVLADGSYRHLSKNEFSVRVLKYYTSKKTGARYPAEWKIDIPSEKMELMVSPLMEDQEFLGTYSTGNYYWEGTCRVEGSSLGRAYVEMTGY
jgi:predicted secreted hydrolase